MSYVHGKCSFLNRLLSIGKHKEGSQLENKTQFTIKEEVKVRSVGLLIPSFHMHMFDS